MTRRRKVEPVEDAACTFETFSKVGAFERDRLTQTEPSCFNGIIRVRKYRVTVELVDEPAEVIAERIRALWRASDNHHHRAPLRAVGEQYGVELDAGEFGIDRRRS